MVTGKNKEQFEKWYIEKDHVTRIMSTYWYFSKLPFEMQIGVYLAYYDSLGIYITCNDNISGDCWYCTFVVDNHLEVGYDKETRNEAYKEAFKEMDKLRNKENERKRI